MSSFFCFQNVRRPLLKKEQPGVDHREIVKVRLTNKIVDDVR